MGKNVQRRNRMVSLTTRLGNFWSDHPSTDLLVVALVALHFIEVAKWGHGDVLSWSPASNRVAIYAAGAGVMSLIAGFAGTAIAQYGSSSGPIVHVLREMYGRTIRINWISITSWLLISALLCIVAMAIDGEKSVTRGSQWVFEMALAIAALKFVRLVFLFNLILKSVTVDSMGSEQPSMPVMRDF